MVGFKHVVNFLFFGLFVSPNIVRNYNLSNVLKIASSVLIVVNCCPVVFELLISNMHFFYYNLMRHQFMDFFQHYFYLILGQVAFSFLVNSIKENFKVESSVQGFIVHNHFSSFLVSTVNDS
jgi:hypothetical protein